MATTNIAQGNRTAPEITAAAGVEDIVNWPGGVDIVRLIIHYASAPIYYTLDGTPAAVQSPACLVAPSAPGVIEDSMPSNPGELRLISSAAFRYTAVRVR